MTLDGGLTMAGGVAVGVNADDQATDVEGSHPYVMLHTGWRFSTGTEPYLAAGMGLGGDDDQQGALDGYAQSYQTWTLD